MEEEQKSQPEEGSLTSGEESTKHEVGGIPSKDENKKEEPPTVQRKNMDEEVPSKETLTMSTAMLKAGDVIGENLLAVNQAEFEDYFAKAILSPHGSHATKAAYDRILGK